MRRLAMLLALVVSTGVSAGCSDDDGGTNDPVDAATPDAGRADADSFCGQVGDPGNDQGVGKFCDTLSDCSDNGAAGICATLGDPRAHFCTRTCANEDAGIEVCGTGASCVCGNGGCGCTPDACL